LLRGTHPVRSLVLVGDRSVRAEQKLGKLKLSLFVVEVRNLDHRIVHKLLVAVTDAGNRMTSRHACRCFSTAVRDEIHRVPELLRQSGESLAGRIAHIDLGPFFTLELPADEATLLNASRLAAGLQISAPTVHRHIDLLAELLLVRKLPPFLRNVGKRLVKSPNIYVRDSGLVHALLGIRTHNDLAGHPVAGASWEGFVVENLLQAAPERTVASFFRTAAGAEIDLLLEIPGHGLWAIEIKLSLAGRPEKGFYIACEDLKPDRRFVVNAGSGSYPIDDRTTAIGVHELAAMLAALDA